MLSTLSRRATSALPRIRTLTPQNARHPFSTTRIASQPRLPATTTPLFSHFTNFTTTQASRRTLTTAQKWKLGFRKARKDIWRKNPIVLPLALLSVFSATCLFAYIAYVEVTQVAPQYTKFPPPMAERLRTAVYYTDVDLQPQKAMAAYKDAIHIGLEMGLHQYSDEVLGVHLQVSHMLEKAGLVSAAVKVLEQTRAGALAWVYRTRRSQAVGASSDEQPENTPDPAKEAEFQAWEDRQQSKVLKKCVGMSMKLAELYESDYMQDLEKAEENQRQAVELCLTEMNRRVALGLPVGNQTKAPATTAEASEEDDGWMNLEEIAVALKDLADLYFTQGKYDLCLPLFIRASDVMKAAEGDAPTCKQPFLMSSIGATMGEIAAAPKPIAGMRAPREQVIAQARQWLDKARDVAAKIDPQGQEAECNEACVAALQSLGELARLENKPDVARKHYRDALSIAQRLEEPGLVEGVKAALKEIKAQ
ncbi:TPR domain protein [Aspergillus violaceofuscus CBS 115571]|uniref:TPR domain protein n=1 Tax=Aspergillus violaceofuscus (strain CBS 115571) TaxID=1450538 RepID=A0A2V5HQ07_ASPV1|nr:TPR domain protein [Aspergillus violaceofuscus CBS 115571]